MFNNWDKIAISVSKPYRAETVVFPGMALHWLNRIWLESKYSK